MKAAEPVFSAFEPRTFWPAALILATAAAALLLIGPIARMFARGSINYNEGWNAYHQQETIDGKPLYRQPPGLVANNYPPISFHLIGFAGRVTGDVNQAGRWVALLSLGAAAWLCGSIVRRLTASQRLAAFTALTVVIWIALYSPDRIGMNDPQLLGSAFSLIGLYAYVRAPRKAAWISLSAAAFTISIFTKHNLLAFPAAVCLRLILDRRWKDLALWGGIAATGSALLFWLTHWIDGGYFLANLLAPRPRTIGVLPFTEYALLFQAPIALAIVWSLLHRVKHVIALALIVAHLVAAAFVGGYGVDRNIFFDCIFALAIAGALAFAELAPAVSRWKLSGISLAALLAAPSFGAMLALPIGLKSAFMPAGVPVWRFVRNQENDFDFAVKLLRGRPGPALCEDLLICFEAGKPLVYEPYSASSLLKLGRLKEEALVAMIDRASFGAVQLQAYTLNRNLAPADTHYFTARFMQALLNRYRVEAWLPNYVLLVPKN